MSLKISQLPNLTASSLTSISSSAAIIPIVANTGSQNVTYNTTMANVKTFIETGNLNVTGAVNGNLTSTFANLVITGNLNVQGTTTTTSSQNLSTNSSIIDLHTFNSNLAPWTSDDGRDIGLRFFWYKGSSAGTSALVWENSNSYLTWYGEGVGNANTGAISGTLGTMQLGQILIANSTATTANATGALQVSGGTSVGGNIYAGGHLYAAGDVAVTGNAFATTMTANANAHVTTNLTVGSRLTVSSIATVNSLGVNTGLTVGTTIIATGNVTANALTVNNSVTISGTATIGNMIPFSSNVSNIGSSSAWYNTVFATSTRAQYADLAEKYLADNNYEPGTVVIFGGEKEITTTTKYADTRVAGVISTDPAYLMNESADGLAVALRGKVPVKIVGKVSKGDLLVTSEINGCGISAQDPSEYIPNAVFAKCLENDDRTEQRLIWAVIV